MEYFLDIVDKTGRLRKERFAEFGATLERAVEIGQADRPSTGRGCDRHRRAPAARHAPSLNGWL